ncbi:MAG: hypothetical protein CUN53_02440 [Phototrophicales bacterium]|nr:MAG: hypothetical protein CUN53_02440 [Phototrophicales bacterium]
MMLKRREVQMELNQRGAQAAGFPLQLSALGLMASAFRTSSLLVICSPGKSFTADQSRAIVTSSRVPFSIFSFSIFSGVESW